MINKYKLLIVLTAVLLVSKASAQTESLPVQNNIKLRLPLSYNGLFSDWITAGLQYERLINTKNSLSLGVNYIGIDGNRFFSSLDKARVQGYSGLMILPQWRHYFRKNQDKYFNGFYVGASAAYLKDNIDRKEAIEKRHVIGLGGLIGYQQVIKKKISLGITPSLHFGLEQSNLPRSSNDRLRMSTIFIHNLDLHLGYIF
jgi:hypothetical protein